ncbi:hypothetical protein WEI85_00585 [Actinomycetes bacterium KLBMP 9797]
MATEHATPVLYFSATIITLDGSDTNAYGEPCQAGQGYVEQSGWWSPDRAYWQVHHDRENVAPDVYPDDEPRGPARWLADQLLARLAAVESYDDARTFYGAVEAVHPGRLTDRVAHPAPDNPAVGNALAFIRQRIGRKGQRFLTAAGHAHGFTDHQLLEAAHLLGLRPQPAPRG